MSVVMLAAALAQAAAAAPPPVTVSIPAAPPPAPPAPPLRPDDRNLQTLWIVAPDPSLAGREVAVKGGELVIRQRLLPLGLARLTGPAVDPKGRFELAAGTELLRVMSGVPVWCLAGKRAPAGVVKWLVGGSDGSFLCLVDADGDGRVEGSFVTASQLGGDLPSITGKRPKLAAPLAAPAGFAPAPSASGTTRYWVGVEYQGKPLLYNRRNFAVSYGHDDARGSLTDWVYTGAQMPASQELLGAKWTVLALEGDRLRVRIDRPLPPQPFGVTRTVTYRFY